VASPASVPLVVHEATRALLRLQSPADARRIAVDLVLGLGGTLVPADTVGPNVIPADVSFGDGAPLLPSAPPASTARALLDRYLSPFLLDARQLLELSGRTERLAESASTDVMTGLPNRRMLERALGRLLDDDTVVMIDLDYFKNVNDTLGHAAGDTVLREFGAVLLEAVRGRDVVGRYGGEEFVVVLAPPAADADGFLDRLRNAWSAKRTMPVTFSAGIARFTGDPDEVMKLVDEALYLAKEAGRDQWIWAADRPASFEQPRDYVQQYLDRAVVGDRRPAVRLTLDLLDNHVPREEIVVDLLAAAQREVGERWHRNELTSADEHVASGVAAAALDALVGETAANERYGRTIVACAEGDWHSLAAQMFGEALRAQGIGVTVLGASTPAEVVGQFLERNGGDSLAISCSLPIFFAGTVHLVNAAHERGIPVIVGGRALGDDDRRAVRLGADAWARTAGEAATILSAWKMEKPAITGESTPIDAVAQRLIAEAGAIGDAAFDALAARFSPMTAYSQSKLDRTREDLVFIVQFVAAAVLVDDHSVLFEFLTWLQQLLANRGVPPAGLITGLEVLLPLVGAVDAGAAQLLDSGRRQLVTS
jgi:diguanylate cyclase (GGDEF)-like protein